LDISPLQSHTIEEDLGNRDFTINALAAPLSSVVHALTQEEPLSTAVTLIDPFNGLNDLQTGMLRVVSALAFRHDPLRMLRAFRFQMRYQLSFDTHTDRLLKYNAPRLLQAAPERIREELMMLLQPEGATERLRALDAHHLLTALIPEFIPARHMPQPALHHWDVFDHSLETVASLEYLNHVLQQPEDEIRQSPLEGSKHGDMVALKQLLLDAEQQNLFSFATFTSPAMKLSALLHDIGKPDTYAVDQEGNITFYHHPQAGVPLIQKIARRLNISTHDARLIQQSAAHHMRPGQLSQGTVTIRAIRRYFMDLGPRGINVALVSLADHLAMRGPEPLTEHWQRHLATVRTLLEHYIHERDTIMPPRLIQTDELIHRLHLEQGPIIGQLLEMISEAQAEGKIRSKEEALWFAEEKLHHLRSSNHKN
jgi:poly(A) polymerase